jgi:hypothetical protein
MFLVFKRMGFLHIAARVFLGQKEYCAPISDIE